MDRMDNFLLGFGEVSMRICLFSELRIAERSYELGAEFYSFLCSLAFFGSVFVLLRLLFLLDACQIMARPVLKGSSNGHDFAHALHGRANASIHRGELLQIPAWYLGHHVVQGWLEAGCGAVCDAVPVPAKQKTGTSENRSATC